MGAVGNLSGVGVAPGELLAVDMPPGAAWLDVVSWCWAEGVAFLPLHHRLTDREKRAIVDLARPAVVLDRSGGSTWFADPGPVHDDVGLVVATSGTAGATRLVELSRRAVSAAVTGSTQALRRAAESEKDLAAPWVCCLSPAHIGGLLVLLRGVLGGAAVLVQDRFDVDRFTKGTPDGACASLVPSMLRSLVESGVDLARFGTLLIGGDAVDPRLADAALSRGARIVATYGLTETCGGVVHDGMPIADTEIRLDTHEHAIEVRGPTVMDGYRADPAATGAAFTVDGWLRTGDVGRLDDDGRLRVEGRVDDLIRAGAEKVWPQEVEAALRDHRKISDVAVAGRPDTEWGRRVVAFVVPRSPDDPPSLAELRAHTAERIAGFKAPRELVLVESLPRTASGKLRRGELAGGV
jgi:O-succinylbenzoic acid--CoA ligase